MFAHPSKKSFTSEVLESLVNGLKAANHGVTISDLYLDNFQSDLTSAEYEREGFARTDLPLPADVRAEQQKIQWADGIIFLYPVWWSDCPAKLKGWFDRVYTAGYAYGYDADGNREIKMKKQKLGLVICTAGHPADLLQETGIAQSMYKIMIEDRLGQRFEKKEMVILGGTLDLQNVKAQHLAKVHTLGKDLDAQLA